MMPTERFLEKIDKSGDCWVWTAALNEDGYGIFNVRAGLQVRAHRYSAMLHYGMFDRRLHVLHRCDNPPCVNPDHLFLGDQVTNMADMTAKGRRAKPGWVKKRCNKGHLLTKDNVVVESNGKRRCLICRQASRG